MKTSGISRRAVILALLLAGCGGSNTPAPNVPLTPTSAGLAGEITGAANRARANAGLAALSSSAALTRVAQNYANTLSQTDAFGHSVDGTTLSGRVTAVGYNFGRIAENLAWTTHRGTDGDIAAMTITNWLGSTGHRANLLDPRLTEIGTGVSQRGDRRLIVQVYGVPR